MSATTRIDAAPVAIPTRYKGYHFRSRLEARWAVFFDAMGWSWDYEVEGFDLGCNGWYLPDFWVRHPEGGRWLVEIKPRAEAADRASYTEDGAPIWKLMAAAPAGWRPSVFCGPPWEFDLVTPGPSRVYVYQRRSPNAAAANAAKSARFEHGERGTT